MPKLSRTQLILGVLLVGSIVYLAITMRSSQSAPPSPRPTATRGQEATASEGAKAQRTLHPAAPANADFRRYAALGSSSLFGAPPLPPAPRKILPTPPMRTIAPPPRPRPRLDLSGWTYAGTVTLTGEQTGVVRLGILQNDATGGVSYLKVGDTFLGATVESVTPESIRFEFDGAVTTLSRPNDFSVLPLSGAPGAPDQTAQPGPPAPRPPRGR